MKEEPQVFKGSWITTAQFSDLVVQNVFHRQLDRSSLPEIDPELQNRHILFRRKFTLDRIDSALYASLVVALIFVIRLMTAGVPA